LNLFFQILESLFGDLSGDLFGDLSGDLSGELEASKVPLLPSKMVNYYLEKLGSSGF
tara:strand:- start:284 stop:454 length:171 start_codon:yes stop_codon:yes gene_type:complete